MTLKLCLYFHAKIDILACGYCPGSNKPIDTLNGSFIQTHIREKSHLFYLNIMGIECVVQCPHPDVMAVTNAIESNLFICHLSRVLIGHRICLCNCFMRFGVKSSSKSVVSERNCPKDAIRFMRICACEQFHQCIATEVYIQQISMFLHHRMVP